MEIREVELNKVLLSLASNLDITKTQFENLAKSYGAVGEYIANDLELKDYYPVISPQGSLRLGTIIQPINEDDDLDVDLVFRLREKKQSWTQKDIKNKVGHRLKDHGRYHDMLDEEGRRCWTLLYRQESDNFKERYHMDILPCVVDKDYDAKFQRMISSAYSLDEIQNLAIRITDKKMPIYETCTDIKQWLKSNPDGYAIWFASRCRVSGEQRSSTMASIMPIGKYVEEKSVLQRIVQLLKRHRDIMFDGDDDKPISIIITTLAAHAYQGETSLTTGLSNVINRMPTFIKTYERGNYIISNPVNPVENFADKWITHPKRKENFFRWMKQVKSDMESILSQQGVELRESIGRIYGKSLSVKAFESIVSAHKNDAMNSKLKVASTGLLGSAGTMTLNAKNTFFGED